MKSESVEQFLARGGKIEKSQKETTLDELLYNEGLLNHEDAQNVKDQLNSALSNKLDTEFQIKK